MTRVDRAAISALTAIAAVCLTALQPSVLPRIELAATALYMGGTDHPLSVPQDTPAYIATYIDWASSAFVGPSDLCSGGDPGCTPAAVYSPEQFWPITGLTDMNFNASVALGLTNLDNCLRGLACTVTDAPFTTTGSRPLTDTVYTVFTYSQSGAIASVEKSDLIAHPSTARVGFVFESNPNRPNGGILERFVGAFIPILGVTFNGATVTNSPEPTPLTTIDIAHQYDPVADFPTNPLNLIADLNTLLGFAYEHPEEGVGTPVLQGQYQDTTYYLVPTVNSDLPLTRPLKLIPFIGPLLATILDPPLRVLVETGYDRTVNPGAPTPARFLYFPNPFTTAINFLVAIPTGLDNGIAYLTGNPANRPFHTDLPGPYGVGGPPVDSGAVDPYGPPSPYRSAASSVGRETVRVRRSSSTPSSPRKRTQAVIAPGAAAERAVALKRNAGSSTGPLRSRS